MNLANVYLPFLKSYPGRVRMKDSEGTRTARAPYTQSPRLRPYIHTPPALKGGFLHGLVIDP